jgi:hypothetical protein
LYPAVACNNINTPLCHSLTKTAAILRTAYYACGFHTNFLLLRLCFQDVDIFYLDATAAVNTRALHPINSAHQGGFLSPAQPIAAD